MNGLLAQKEMLKVRGCSMRSAAVKPYRADRQAGLPVLLSFLASTIRAGGFRRCQVDRAPQLRWGGRRAALLACGPYRGWRRYGWGPGYGWGESAVGAAGAGDAVTDKTEKQNE
jgi:hypothetical protein